MTSEGKTLVNGLYHAAVVGGLAIGCAKITQLVLKVPLPKLDLTPRDMGMLALDITAATAAKDFLVKQGVLPHDIMR